MIYSDIKNFILNPIYNKTSNTEQLESIFLTSDKNNNLSPKKNSKEEERNLIFEYIDVKKKYVIQYYINH